MGHKFIKEISSGEYIDEVYLVTDPILRSTTNGDLYIAMYISDRTGRLNGRMWQATEAAYEKLPKPGFVRIQGRSELYKNNLQIVINQFGVVNESQVNLEDFLARTKKDTKKMFAELVQILSKVKHAQLRKLIEVFLADKKLMDKFCKAPAAAKLHHDCLGGLLEHTHNMLNAAVKILPLYPQLQSDLVLTGIFLHDIG
ncbi:MAG: 3'-5' exoribonuclease YhaM family protein, partial [Planctomycetota bacterium]